MWRLQKNHPPETTMNHEIPVSNSIDKDRNRHISTLYITVRDSLLLFLLFKKKTKLLISNTGLQIANKLKNLTLFLIYHKLLPVRMDKNSKTIDFKIFTKEWDLFNLNNLFFKQLIQILTKNQKETKKCLC